MEIRGHCSYEYQMLLEIVRQWTLEYVDQLNNGIHENWFLSNIDYATIDTVLGLFCSA